MAETTPNSKGPAQVQFTPPTTEPTLIPADQVKPEDVGRLSLRYVDGVAQLVVSGGTAIPGGLAVVDESGNTVAAYTAGAASALPRHGSTALQVSSGMAGALIIR
ncbi:hypothetical protein [Streptomyces sp. NPDC057494]|uniref:hypothetical protein n=1 Tax=Streptomyces sp. NPDC057494 TaxID=3346148 RepID=UPI0036AD8BD9